jgi:hypothetical protein
VAFTWTRPRFPCFFLVFYSVSYFPGLFRQGEWIIITPVNDDDIFRVMPPLVQVGVIHHDLMGDYL